METEEDKVSPVYMQWKPILVNKQIMTKKKLLRAHYPFLTQGSAEIKQKTGRLVHPNELWNRAYKIKWTCRKEHLQCYLWEKNYC